MAIPGSEQLGKLKSFITTKWNSGMTGKIIAIVVVGAIIYVVMFVFKKVTKR